MNYYLSVYEKKCKSFLILQAFIFPSFCCPGQSYDYPVSRDYINFFTLATVREIHHVFIFYLLQYIQYNILKVQRENVREIERERDFLCSMYLDVKACTGWPSS